MRKGNKILFFCPLPPPIGGQALMSEIVYKVIQPDFLINTNMKSKYLGTFICIAQTFWYLLIHRIDLVYFTCTRSKVGAIKDIVLLTLCKLRKIKVINHLHGNEIMDLFTGGSFSKLILWAYKQIDTTIFVTERQKELMPPSLNKMRKIVIPNCFDPILEKVNRIISDESRDIHVLFVSFIMKSKGIFVALEVFERIAKEYENVFFHIAGQPLGDYLMPESEVKELFGKHFRRLDSEYPGRFVYHGVVKDDEKIDLFTKCDIFLFPTFFKTESFGLVNIEAMRTGNAVITTNHNFLPDIVTKNEGILVEPNNIEDTYMGMKYLIENPNKMKDLQRHNMDHAKNTYSPEAFKKLIKNLFMEFMLLDLHK